MKEAVWVTKALPCFQRGEIESQWNLPTGSGGGDTVSAEGQGNPGRDYPSCPLMPREDSQMLHLTSKAVSGPRAEASAFLALMQENPASS